ncbi:uncharacterized protein LOC133415502 isoform X5 [Phycodurus eques]|uniref:uncharacterized protein LOC133415502 isoform X5 n=1 Tax=Phycodurus eques TaxID=693459 RepID=UPI002ACD2C34|nr:uncharacterized protein LOC133415502 isoform X5 [Phycodurus eques]
MNSKNPKDLTSTNVQPAKSGKYDGEKKGYMHGIKGQISQIPGLSPIVNTVSDVKNIGKRVGVLDSDSDYVKLAKQGGHKGLLYFDDTVTSKPNSFDSADVVLNGPVEALGNLRKRRFLKNSWCNGRRPVQIREGANSGGLYLPRKPLQSTCRSC